MKSSTTPTGTTECPATAPSTLSADTSPASIQQSTATNMSQLLTSTGTDACPTSAPSTTTGPAPDPQQASADNPTAPIPNVPSAPPIPRFDPQQIHLPLARFFFAPTPYKGVVAFLGKAIRIEESGTSKEPLDYALWEQQIEDFNMAGLCLFCLISAKRPQLTAEGVLLDLLAFRLRWTTDENYSTEYALEVADHLSRAVHTFDSKMVRAALNRGFGPPCPLLGEGIHYTRDFNLTVCPLRTAWEVDGESVGQ